MWKKNHYYRPKRWFWGSFRRIGRHQYRLRILKRWTGRRWVNVRAYWRLYRRNKYNHRAHGKRMSRWGRWRRIGNHLYRHRCLYRNIQGRWRKYRCRWILRRKNHYRRRSANWGRWLGPQRRKTGHMFGDYYYRSAAHNYRGGVKLEKRHPRAAMARLKRSIKRWNIAAHRYKLNKKRI